MKTKVTLMIAKIISFIVVFIAAVFIFSELLNKGNTDMTAKMEEASLPLVFVQENDITMNSLHGYSQEMNTTLLRDCITPIENDRTIHFSIDSYGTEIESIVFEVRSVDGERLIEHTEVKDFNTISDNILFSITIKDLLEQNTEYTLDLIIHTGQQQDIHYYTRIIQSDSFHLQEKLEFAKFFHDSTFDKEKAKDITRYLESNSSGDNSSLGKVNINSSFKQITWADLQMKEETEPVMTLKEIASDTATIHMDYIASESVGKEKHYYRIKEYYRVRYTADRMYLLSFEREMSQLYDEEADNYTSGAVQLGIQDSDVVTMESDGGDIVTFVIEDRLFCYNSSDNSISNVYGFYRPGDRDIRTLYDACDIEVLSVDETGNVRFMVYGYMNRGLHEGEVGVGIYYFNSLYSTVEEEAFLPYDKPYELLKLDITKLHYASKDNQFYLMLDSVIYKVDLAGKEYTVLADGLTEDNYEVSPDHHMILFQNGSHIYESTQLTLINLNTQNVSTIYAEEGSYIMPLGFMGEDVIYGEAKQSAVVTYSSGETLFPMYRVNIQNEIGEVLKTYSNENIFVTDAQIEDNQLILSRVKLDEDGNYIKAEDDQILNNQVKAVNENTISYPITQQYEKIAQLNLANNMNVKNLKQILFKMIIFEGSRNIALEQDNDTPERFYVYGLHGAIAEKTHAGDAVQLASSMSGVVINDQGEYVWLKGTRSSINQIMAIQEDVVSEDRNSLSVCLDTMLSFEGVVRNTSLMLQEGENAIEILQDNLTGKQILELSGCSLEMMLFYLNKDVPVLALLNNGEAVLLVGYNTYQIALLDPITGTIYKKTMTSADEWFSENGNKFITYVK